MNSGGNGEPVVVGTQTKCASEIQTVAINDDL